MYRAIFIALACAATISASEASAEPLNVSATRMVRISYADLRLDTQDGLITLRKRAREAAKQVCGFNEWPMEMAIVRHTCLKAVMRNADGQIERAATLTQMPPAMADADPHPKTITLAVRR